MLKVERLIIPEWLKVENKAMAALYEVINEELEECPDMSVSELVERLNKVTVNESYKRLQAVIRKQFGQ